LTKYFAYFSKSVVEQLKKISENQHNFKEALDSGIQSQSQIQENLDEAEDTKRQHSNVLSEIMGPEFQRINNSINFLGNLIIDDFRVNFTSSKKRRHTNSNSFDSVNSDILDEDDSSPPIPVSCDEKEFLCSKFNHCIDLTSVCDGYNDCGDNEDESNCTRKCRADQTACMNGIQLRQCISNAVLCDGEDDCGDFQDETNCNTDARPCAKQTLGCSGEMKKCIRPGSLCDRRNDCGNNEDEEHCGRSSIAASCPLGLFTCSSNERCISRSLICNGKNDCGDNEDEIGCDGNLLFVCGHNHENISMSLVCDGKADCGNNKDEVNCFQNTNNATNMCKNRGLFSCEGSSEKCISHKLVCNGMDDCGNGGDEKYCGGNLADVAELKKFRLPQL